MDDVARARPASPTATTQPTLAADVTPHAVPHEKEARAGLNQVATTPSILAPAAPAVPPDSARSGGSKGWWHRSLEWLRSPGLLVTVGAAAIASVVTWQVVKPSVPDGEFPFGFGGSAVVGDTGRLRCPPGTQPRSESIGGGRRAIWCERPSPDGPIRAPWIELDASGSPRTIGRYVGDQREGAFLSIDVDHGVVQTQALCFSGGPVRMRRAMTRSRAPEAARELRHQRRNSEPPELQAA